MANLDTAPLGISSVQAGRYNLAFGPLTNQELEYDLSAPDTQECWIPLTQRLLSYFAKVFSTRTAGNRLDRLMAAVARELSGCTEVVTLINSADARGDGAFHVRTRFGPITEVLSVNRVDEDGNVLEAYSVVTFDENNITVAGTHAPGQGDRLAVTYAYLFGGLEYQVKQALLELNILTSTGTFLDAWGRWFGLARQKVGKYGFGKYGGQQYGAEGRESDSQFSRRIIDRITQSRNTPNAIRAVVERLTGAPVYVVDWINSDNPTGWIFKPSATSAWAGDDSAEGVSKHLIWGRTSRFLNASVTGGGACVFEVLVPSGSTVPFGQIVAVVNQYKPAGTRCYVIYQTAVAAAPEPPDSLSVGP